MFSIGTFLAPNTINQMQRNGRKPREQLACHECHRRKQKCDRQQPCQNCKSRRHPEKCRFPVENHIPRPRAQFRPGEGDDPLKMEMMARISRLERLLCLQDHAHLEKRLRLAEEAVLATLDIAPTVGQEAPQASPCTSTTPAADIPPGQISGLYIGSLAVAAVGRSETHHNHRLMTAETTFTQVRPLAIVDSTLGPSTIPWAEMDSILAKLPDKEDCLRLIDRYYVAWDWTRYPLPRDVFPEDWAALLEVKASPASETRAKQIHYFLPIVGLLCSVLALGATDPAHCQSTLPDAAVQYFWMASKAFMYCDCAGIGGSLLVYGRMVQLRFAEMTRNVHVSLNVLGLLIRTAVDQGYHRDGNELALTRDEIAKRRLVWSHILHADAEWSLVWGRPTAIGGHTSRMPGADDMYQEYGWGFTMFVTWRNQFVPILAAIAKVLREQVESGVCLTADPKENTAYNSVLEVDHQFEVYLDQLPDYLAEDTRVDASLGSACPRLAFYRHLTISQAYFYRICLHRPYMLAPLRNGQHPYRKSWQICVDAALGDLRAREAARVLLRPEEKSQTFGGRWAHFNSAVVLGLSMLISLDMGELPQTATFVEQLGFLQSYMELLQSDNGSDVGSRTIIASQEQRVMLALMEKLKNRMELLSVVGGPGSIDPALAGSLDAPVDSSSNSDVVGIDFNPFASVALSNPLEGEQAFNWEDFLSSHYASADFA